MASVKGSSLNDTATPMGGTLVSYQANLGRGYGATQECLKDAEDERVGILLLQEPYVGAKGYLTMGYHIGFSSKKLAVAR